jgi:hypothetical protein
MPAEPLLSVIFLPLTSMRATTTCRKPADKLTYLNAYAFAGVSSAGECVLM